MFVSTSVAVSVIAFGVLRRTPTFWALATGASFTGVTVMDTVPGALVSEPSLTLNVKLSEPYQSWSGI